MDGPEDFDPVKFANTEDFDEDVPFEERLQVGLALQRGIRDAAEGRVYTVDEVRERLSRSASGVESSGGGRIIT